MLISFALIPGFLLASKRMKAEDGAKPVILNSSSAIALIVRANEVMLKNKSPEKSTGDLTGADFFVCIANLFYYRLQLQINKNFYLIPTVLRKFLTSSSRNSRHSPEGKPSIVRVTIL